MVLGMAELSPATRRVREDFLPTWGIFGGQKVLTMEPYAFPSVRDLVYMPDGAGVTRAHWGLIADLANLLQARAHVILGVTDPDTAANAYQELVASWEAQPGVIVAAGDGLGGQLIEAFTGPKPDFVFPISDSMKMSFLPKTGEAKRQISKLVWGESNE